MGASTTSSPDLTSLMVRLIFVSLLGFKGALALSPFAFRTRQNTDSVPFVNPNLAGGSLIDNAGDGLGEPLNVNTFPPHWFSRSSALMRDF